MTGSLINLGDNPSIQDFPAANFTIQGDVPTTQCTEAQIEGDNALTISIIKRLDDTPNKFLGIDLTGKICHITASVGGNTGDFDITSNNPDGLNLLQDPGDGNPVTYHVTDAGEFQLTRNTASFAAFIHAAGYAYTFKGGKLWSNIPPGQLQPACTIHWDPIT